MEESVSADVPGEKMASLIVPDLDLKHVLDVLEAGGYGAWIVGCLLYTSDAADE